MEKKPQSMEEHDEQLRRMVGKWQFYMAGEKSLALKARIEEKRGCKLTLPFAVSLAFDWEMIVDKAWDEFVKQTDELLDHVWGRPGDPEWTEERQIQDFQWLYKRLYGEDVSIEKALELRDAVIPTVCGIYELDNPLVRPLPPLSEKTKGLIQGWKNS